MIRRFARPYARAFMDVAGNPQQAQVILAELASFEKARKSAPDLAELLNNPGVSSDTKQRIATEIGKRLGLSALSAKILEVLVRNQRVNQTGAILEAWRDLINKTLGISVAKVRAAHELSADEQTRLRTALEAKVGRKIELELSTDPTLLSGFVATVESSVYDASMLGQIQRLDTANL